MAPRRLWLAAVLASTAVHAAPYDDATRDAPPARDGSIGTAHPIGGYAAAADGRWLILCQARADTDHDGRIDVTYDIHVTSGDRLLPYLVLGSGAGMQIDYLAARSARGDWLAVVRHGQLELIEAATYHRWVLPGVDLVHDRLWTDQHNVRSVSIAASGTRMTYLRKDGDHDVIVIRDLPSGAERVVSVTGMLWRATVDPAGRWARVQVMRSDTDGDGKIEWPGGPSPVALGGCGSDIIHHRDPTDGDRPTVLWLDLASGALVDDPDVVGVVGDDLLRRRRDGSLVLGRDVLPGPRCPTEITGVIASPPRVIVACRARGGRQSQDSRAPLEILGPGFHKQTHRTEYLFGEDHVSRQDRFELIDDKVPDRLTFVDLVTGDEITVPTPYVYTHDQFVVMRLPDDWAVFDLIKRSQTALHARGGFGNYSGPIVEIGASRYDVRTGKRIGAVTDEIVLVDDHGRVLLGPGVKTPAGHFSPGPLRWAP